MKRVDIYNAPAVMMIEVKVEAGFNASGSGGINDGNDGGEV